MEHPFEVISNLPDLEAISLSFDMSFWNNLDFSTPSVMPPPHFKNLRHISLESLLWYQNGTNFGTTQYIREMLLRSPQLERLKLGAMSPEWNSEITAEFGELVEDIAATKGFRPTVSDLELEHLSLGPSRSSHWIPYLARLNSLEIFSLPDQTCMIFQDSGIKLESLDIGVLSDGVIGYLQSYQGLKYLRVRRLTESIDQKDIQSRTLASIVRSRKSRLSEALCTHQDTLLSYRIECAHQTSGGAVVRWSLDGQTLESFKQLKLLNTLEVVFLYNKHGEGVDIPLVSGSQGFLHRPEVDHVHPYLSARCPDRTLCAVPPIEDSQTQPCLPRTILSRSGFRR